MSADSQNTLKNKTSKETMMRLIHTAIGLGILVFFYTVPPFEPITEVGMRITGIFIMMVYLWSALDSIWPSILGLVLMAFSGYVDATGYAALKNVALNSFGYETIVILMLSMVFFGAVQYVGVSQYMARWFLTRKIINGRPYIFWFIFIFADYMICGLTHPVSALFIFWPIALEFLKEFGVTRKEKLYPLMIISVYVGATLGQPMFPFKGGALFITGVWLSTTGIEINYLSYFLLNFVMAFVMILFFLAWIRFIVRPDVSSIQNIDTEYFDRNPLPPMNLQQKIFFSSIFIYIFCLLAPSFLPATIPGMALLKSLGTIGVTAIMVIILLIIPINGKPCLPYKEVAAKHFSWDTLFLCAAAIYTATALTNNMTGVKEFLMLMLSPLLSDKPVFIFLLLILGFALITTNFANNGAMAVVLLPVILTFAEQYPGIGGMALFMNVIMMVHVAILTPAASPYAGMLHARKEDVTFKEIISVGLPLCVAAWIFYTVLGVPLANMLFGM